MPFLMALALLTASNAVVVKPVANMYSKPGEDADVVSQAIYGSNTTVVEQQAGWARVRTEDDYTGWIPLASLRLDKPYAAEGRVAQVRSMFAHIYRETSVTKHAPLLTVPFETKLEIVAGEDPWLQVRLADDRSGWIQSGDVTFEPTRLSVPELVEFSKRFLGLPYTWGGTSSFGYDCSGFTQMLSRRRGVMLPRDAGPQAHWTGVVPVKAADLEPGDLLYFGKSEDKITHTGMYMGDGKFINATTHEQPVIQISELADPHWQELFVCARRLK